MKRDGTRDFHEARWDEPILMELGEPGQRALLLEEIEPQVAQAAGAPDDLVPQGYLRREAPKLPELGQMQLLRHYLRLSQETIGADLNIDIGLGTCTMKYNPRVNEEAAAQPGFTQLHPLQPVETVQGALEVLATAERLLCEITGMDGMSFQPAAGAHATGDGIVVGGDPGGAAGGLDLVELQVVLVDTSAGVGNAEPQRACQHTVFEYDISHLIGTEQIGILGFH